MRSRRRPAARDRVDAAFEHVPRSRFLPPSEVPHADEDRPLPLGHGQTSSQPSTVAAMLRLLDVPTGTRVLDVGAGSGWTTALLAQLVGPGGMVLGLELEPALARWGATNLLAHGARNARLEPAREGVLGDPAGAPWDRVLVSAEATALPQSLVEQVAVGGRMVVPVRGEMLLVRRTGTGIESSGHGAYRFVPLR